MRVERTSERNFTYGTSNLFASVQSVSAINKDAFFSSRIFFEGKNMDGRRIYKQFGVTKIREGGGRTKIRTKIKSKKKKKKNRDKQDNK